MKIYQLRNEKQWRELLTKIAAELKMAFSLRDEQGESLLVIGEHCPLCQVAEDIPGLFQQVCACSNAELRSKAMLSKEPVVDYCDVGLLRMIVPVTVEDSLLGMVVGCTLTARQQDADLLAFQQRLGINEEQLNEIIGQLPVRTMEDFQAYASFVSKRINKTLT